MSYDDYDLAAAIKRIETSKDSHVRWAEHLVDVAHRYRSTFKLVKST